jgi:hypothetical protein
MMNTTTHIRAGSGPGIEPNGRGAGIDPNG